MCQVSPEIFITSRGDFRDSVAIQVKEVVNGEFSQLIHLSPNVKEIRLDPMSEEGSFELSHVRVKPLEKQENASLLVADHLQEELETAALSQDKLRVQREHFLNQSKLSEVAKKQGSKTWEAEKNSAFGLLNPRVSVVVTLYNYESYIEECLESVVGSSLKELEVIVVDDASQDQGRNRVSHWMKNVQTPVALVKKFFNTGLAESRNLGIEMARAPYVFILDADNKLFSQGLSRLYYWIQEHNLDFVFGILQRFDSEKSGIGLLSHYEWNEKHLLEEPYIDAMALLKKTAIQTCGGYQTDFSVQAVMGWEDYDLWLRFLEKGFKGGLYPNFIGSYRVHASSMIRGATKHLEEIGNYFQKRYAHLVERSGVEGKCFGWQKK